MAKYIIDIPNEIAEASARYWNEATNMTLVPYTEPSQKTIDLQHAHDIENVAIMNYNEGAEDAWEFASMLMNMHPDVAEDIYWSMNGGKGIGVAAEMTYSEAKAKYEAWKKKKEEIHVGDEVKYRGDNCVVVYVGADEVYHLSDKHWSRCVVQGRQFLTKTGRHFEEVEKLLERMR